jgi:hypothetical protein
MFMNSRLGRRGFFAALFLAAAMTAIPARATTITVNSTQNTATPGDGQCTLREAINNSSNPGTDTTGGDCAVATGVDVINFSISDAKIQVNGLIVNNNLTIDGGAHNITIATSGGMDINYGPLYLTNLSFVAASASVGTTIDNHTTGSVVISNCYIDGGNPAVDFFYGQSHAIGNLGRMTIENSTIGGGGIDNGAPGNLSVTNSFLTGFVPLGSGGALLNGFGATASISNSTLSGIVGATGAAIYNDGTLAVTNCTFFNNVTNVYGNLANFGWTSTGDSIPGPEGAAIFNNLGTATFTNSILADGNGASECAVGRFTLPDGGNPIINGGYNISDDNSCGFGASIGADGQTIGDAVNPQVDSNLYNHGGPTQTYALLPGSPAIDAVPLANCPSTDQRGFARPAPGHNACDVGAYEYGYDTTPPSISISAPSTGTYLLNESIAASYGCTDPDDAVTVCSGTVANGTNIDTASIGAKTFTVNATDSHSNSSSQNVAYNVAYNICVDYDTAHARQIGSAVPIKLKVCDVAGVNQSASSIILHATGVVMVSDNAPDPLADTGNANPDDDFRFDPASNEYIFNLSTKGYPSGTFALEFTAGSDPTSHPAFLQLK